MARSVPEDPLTHQIRAAFRDALEEPLPQDLLALLARLDDDGGRRDPDGRQPADRMAMLDA